MAPTSGCGPVARGR